MPRSTQATCARRWYDKNREVVMESAREWKKRNPGAVSESNRRQRLRRYGLTPETELAMREAQQHKCAICRSELLPNTLEVRNRTCIDHCHVTGKVRGILCSRCNRAIGLLGDDIEILVSAAAYLMENK